MIIKQYLENSATHLAYYGIISNDKSRSIRDIGSISVDAKITILLTPIKITIMETNELIQLVEETTDLRKLKKLMDENSITVDIKGMTIDKAKAAVIEYLKPEDDDEDDDVENNDDENDAEDGEADDAEDGEADDDEDGDAEDEKKPRRNAGKKQKTMAEIIKEMKADTSRDVDFIEREIKFLNSLRDVEGEYGEYAMGTLTLAEPIEGYVASVNEENGETEYTLGDQELVNFIVPSLIHTLRDNPEMAGIYNKVRDDDSLLYKVLAGTTVKMAVEYVPANTDWVNPLSRNRNKQTRQFDHDTVITTIYGIKNLGPDAELWADLERVGSIGAISPAVVLALLDRSKKKIKSRR